MMRLFTMRLFRMRCARTESRLLLVLLLLLTSAGLGCANLEGGGGSGDGSGAEAGSNSGTAGTDTGAAAADTNAPQGWHAAAAGECDGPWFSVSWVADGDTLQLETGDNVRFLGIDTPETTSKDCMAFEAKSFTLKNAPKGSKVCLSSDKKAGNKDLYGRLLRYVFVEQAGVPVLLNARLVRLGLARVYNSFAKGLRHEQILRADEKAAKQQSVGGWQSCGW